MFRNLLDKKYQKFRYMKRHNDNLVITNTTPFHCNSQQYIQKEDVSMGSPLRPTYADYYVAYHEKISFLFSN